MTVVAVSAGLPSGPAAADGFGGSFSALAAADGVRVTMVVPGGPLSDRAADGGGPSAQARLDSLGTSRAFASFPYPGDTVANSPGIVRTASGAPVPDLPFYVASDHPVVPEQQVGSGPYRLQAQSSDRTSAATASVGLAADPAAAIGLVRSEAKVTDGPEAVVSEGTSTIDSFSAGPLHIGRVVSHARVSLSADGTRTRVADTDVTGASVGAVAVRLTPTGLHVGDTEAPVADTSAVAQALAAAGITVELMPRQEFPSGVVAPAVRVTQTQTSGTKVIYVLGAASASSDGTAADTAAPSLPEAAPSPSSSDGSGSAGAEPAPPAGSGDGNATGTTGASTSEPPGTAAGAPAFESPTATAAGTAAGLGSSADIGAAQTIPPDGLAAEGSAGAGSPNPSGAPAGGDRARAAAVSALLGTGVDTKPLYGVLVVGAVLALGLAAVMRGLRPGGTR